MHFISFIFVFLRFIKFICTLAYINTYNLFKIFCRLASSKFSDLQDALSLNFKGHCTRSHTFYNGIYSCVSVKLKCNLSNWPLHFFFLTGKGLSLCFYNFLAQRAQRRAYLQTSREHNNPSLLESKVKKLTNATAYKSQ